MLLYGGELLAPIVAALGGLIHEVTGDSTVGGVEGSRSGLGSTETVAPGGAVVNCRSNRKNGGFRKGLILYLLLQKAAGVFVQPVLQGLIKFAGAHGAAEGGSIVVISDGLQGIFIDRQILIEPKGVGQNTGVKTIVIVADVPNVGGLAAQRLQICAAQNV